MYFNIIGNLLGFPGWFYMHDDMIKILEFIIKLGSIYNTHEFYSYKVFIQE
jgi:mevalonate pyrophosphate decarboxylase